MEMGTLLVSLLCSVELPHVFRWRMGADIYTKGEAAMARQQWRLLLELSRYQATEHAVTLCRKRPFL